VAVMPPGREPVPVGNPPWSMGIGGGGLVGVGKIDPMFANMAAKGSVFVPVVPDVPVVPVVPVVPAVPVVPPVPLKGSVRPVPANS
jgi:hypothetical protein